MTGQPGTIVELEPLDGLGWIELDGGAGRIRFGGSAMKGFNFEWGVGTRVVVNGTAPGFKGVLKAVQVLPFDPVTGGAPPPRVIPEVSWPEFVAAHPRFSDVGDVAVPCATPVP